LIKGFIKKFTNTEDKKRLLSNFISLSVLQGANYILPLITLPYLVRVLGPEKFGLIAFAQAFIQYFVILTDYGFNLSATREISIHRENKGKVSEIFSSVMIIKLGLLILSILIMSVIVFSFEKFRADWGIYFLTFGMVAGQVLFPVWFFQGMERMKYITFLNIMAKLIFTVAIFVFIHEASDYIYVPLINSLGFIVAGVLALWIVFRNFGVSFKLPCFYDIKYQLGGGWHLFVSTVGVSLYRSADTVILGLFSSNLIVGYYSVARKILSAIQNLQSPIGQTLFPYFSNRFKLIGSYSAKNLLFKFSKFVFFIYFIISILTFIFSNQLVYIVSGQHYSYSIYDLKILSIVIVIGGLNYYFGILGLVSLGHNKYFSKSVIATGIFFILISLLLVPILKDKGVSLAIVLSESLLLTFLFRYLIILK
jgi:PST family polysaccharide transporter